MILQKHTVAIEVAKSPAEVFKCVNTPGKWWPEDVDGESTKLDDEFVFTSGDSHYSKNKIIELIPNQKVVWLVTDSNLNFISDKSEWTNTRISFEITPVDGKTQVRFTHIGLVPEGECYDACSNAWSEYIHQSLFPLISTGKGRPTPAEKVSGKTV